MSYQLKKQKTLSYTSQPCQDFGYAFPDKRLDSFDIAFSVDE